MTRSRFPAIRLYSKQAPGTGAKGAIGFADPKLQGKALPGERRIYSRMVDGRLVCEIWLKSDGLHVEVHEQEFPITLKSKGQIVLDSPDIRIGGEGGSRQIACVGDLVAGSVRALSTAPTNPIVPVPPALLTPSGGVPFVGKIISGSSRAKAT